MNAATPEFVLISHTLCPYVQRAAIALYEKGIAFERRDIDLANKPAWFLDLSPLGKTPVLLVDGTPIFESAVICDFLDETQAPALHPPEPIVRARHRSWIEFGSALLNAIGSFYNAADEALLRDRANDIHARFRQIESTLGAGPYFAGSAFSLVDATFGPVFRYFDVFESIDDFAFFQDLPKVSAWRAQLSQRPSIQAAVSSDYPRLLTQFLVRRGSALSDRITKA
ncbi:stringent starvation protein [Bordetella ansorpii]|uniref:glutathione transferase n=1 Tax=Bordetella ansorpii TaxID=288768 RepID=A0A157SSH3_9BORD|nr:glutathione S-transferase family protein [Bordetella ansorpii]SAI73093.1 stringent starvation protein [Bordetella ansorpii]